MTNIKENTETKNMRSHIDDAYTFLNKYLPHRYCPIIQKRLKEQGVDVGVTTITNVRNRKIEKRLDVLNALLTLTKEKEALKLVETLAN